MYVQRKKYLTEKKLARGTLKIHTNEPEHTAATAKQALVYILGGALTFTGVKK